MGVASWTRARCLLQRPPPGIEAHVQCAVEGDRREVPVAAPQVEDGSGHRQIGVEIDFDGAQEAAEGREFA